MYYRLPGEPAVWEDNSLLLKMQGDATFNVAFSLFNSEEGSKVWALQDWLFLHYQHITHICKDVLSRQNFISHTVLPQTFFLCKII